MFGQAKASFLVSNPREQRICTIGEAFRVLKSRIFRASACAKAHAIAPKLVEESIPSPNEERSWKKVEHSALSILSAFRVSRFSVKLLKPDNPSDFRICEIKERGTERLVFTGRVLKSQATRPQVERDIARWCEPNPNKLPNDGGTVLIDLASISI
jgi:hypothetical protein